MINSKGQLCKVIAKHIDGENTIMVYENPTGTFGTTWEFYLNNQYVTCCYCDEDEFNAVFLTMCSMLKHKHLIV